MGGPVPEDAMEVSELNECIPRVAGGPANDTDTRCCKQFLERLELRCDTRLEGLPVPD